MAIVYPGMSNELDERMLDVLQNLPDEYYIFTTFRVPNYGREIDFLVIRQHHELGGIFCLEVKDETRPLIGTINGPWEYKAETDNIRLPYPRPNSEDANPLQQAYNNAATFKKWLSSMRDLLQDPDDPWFPDQVRELAVFPRLVLSRAHEDNQIQYDSWVIRFDSYDEVLNGRYALHRWIPKQPFYFSATEIERIARYLGMGQPVERSRNGFVFPELPEEDGHLDTIVALRSEVTALRELVRMQSATIQELRTLVQEHEGLLSRFAEAFNRRGQPIS